jgi:FkbM family methyltransferase
MKIYPEDNRFIKEVIEDSEYGFLNHYPIVVDVGANIGAFSMWIYDHADKIYAIEPVEENVKFLRKNVEKNNLSKIIIKQMGLSDRSIIRKMRKSGDPKEGGWAISEAGDYEVDCRTLADFMETENIKYIDLLKLDTEGHELNILNASYFPYQKVGAIIGELHGSADVKALLEWYGYRYMETPNNHFLARK